MQQISIQLHQFNSTVAYKTNKFTIDINIKFKLGKIYFSNKYLVLYIIIY
jgi:hypothetical protein